MSDPVTQTEFAEILDARYGALLDGVEAVAVGVSGGSDSFALLKLLSAWAEARGGPVVHALIVDHGLRAETGSESYEVQVLTTDWPQVEAYVLKWEEPADSRIQEAARDARYGLMSAHCKMYGIEYLFIGHHQDDQAETFLFRLAKGSGLDGLGAMRDRQKMRGVTVLRPLIDVPKARLVATCAAAEVEYVRDPSNENTDFARVRLRGAMTALEEEGLTRKRLSRTAMRLARASEALDDVRDAVMEVAIIEQGDARIVIDVGKFLIAHEEIVVRGVLWCFDVLGDEGGKGYGPRMERVESLARDLIRSDAFRKRTLGGLVFERDDQNKQVVICKEKK